MEVYRNMMCFNISNLNKLITKNMWEWMKYMVYCTLLIKT